MTADTLQDSPRIRATNVAIAKQALKNVPYELLSEVMASLADTHGKVRAEMALEAAIERMGR